DKAAADKAAADRAAADKAAADKAAADKAAADRAAADKAAADKAAADKAAADRAAADKAAADKAAADKAAADKAAADKAAADKAAADKAAADKAAADKAAADKAAADKAAADKAAADKAAADKAAADKAAADKAAADKAAADKAAADKAAADKAAADKAAADKAAADKAAADKAAADKAKQDAQPRSVPVPKDDATASMNNIARDAENARKVQKELINKLKQTVSSKENDLNDLKEENDLSDRGIVRGPRPFKSVSAERKALAALKVDLDKAIESQNAKIRRLDQIYKDRLKKIPSKTDETNVFYQEKLKELKVEQSETMKLKTDLLAQLEQIKIETEIEKKRRIKRAVYDNEQDRFEKDRAALANIKQNTPVSTTPLTVDDFDFGEKQSKEIQILKGVSNVDKGFYIVVAVHKSEAKRDAFLRKAISAGQSNINFFYDVNTSKYFIYYEKYNDLNQAKNSMASKGSQPYDAKVSMIKIE
uniref:histone H1-like repetitive region-containing protein n=1 Tax=uncultured Algibacter sp. TaxID=298659 RepID=UPI0032171769